MRKWFRVLIPFIPALVLGSCSNKAPAPADSEKAREALALALDTWIKGGSTDDLEKRSPPIYINEPEWKAGKRLLRFQIKGEPEFFGRQLRGVVQLSLQGKGGTTEEKEIHYQIDTLSRIVIVREF